MSRIRFFLPLTILFLVALLLIGLARTSLAGDFEAPAEPALEVIYVTGDIISDTTWIADNVYVLQDNDITISATATLTVEVGTIVKVHGNGPGSGDCSSSAQQRNLIVDGTLIADGEPGNPIYFTSLRDDTVGGDTNGDGGGTVPAAGNWGRIEIRNTASSTILDNVVVRYAGATDYSGSCNANPVKYGAVTITDNAPTVTNSIFANNYAWGIHMSDSDAIPGTTSPVITGNNFINHGDSVLSADMGSFPSLSGNSFSNNNGNGLEIRGGTISGSAVWDQTSVAYAVEGDITIPTGASLTIAPGMAIKFNGNGPGSGDCSSSAQQRNLFVDGTLIADGEPGNPIYFTSLRDDTVGGDTNGDGGGTVPAAGNWGRIEIRNTASSTVLDNIVVRYAGATDYSGNCNANPVKYGALIITDNAPTVTNSIFANNYAWGIHMSDSDAIPGTTSPVITGNNFINHGDSVLSADMGSFPSLSGNSFSNNNGNGLEIRGGTITGSAVWDQTSVAYAVEGDITIPTGASLTIAPGMAIKFNGNGPGSTSCSSSAQQRNLFVDGTLIADGEPGNPIYFTSLRDDTVGGDTNGDGGGTVPAAGNWGRVEIRNTASSTILDNTVVRYAGATDYSGSCNAGPVKYGALIITDNAPTITSSIFANNYAWGIYMSDSDAIPGATSPLITDNSFTNHGDAVLSADMGSFPVLSTNSFSNNNGNGLEIRGGTVTGNAVWDQIGVAYAVEGDITIPTGATLTIAPGVVVKFSSTPRLFVDGVLDAQGAAANLIHITSIKDDSVAGDTNGDGFVSAPSPGDWKHILFRNPNDQSLLEYTAIRYGGNGGYMVHSNGAFLSVQYSLLEHSSGDGLYIYHDGSDPDVTVQYSTFRQNNWAGVQVVGP